MQNLPRNAYDAKKHSINCRKSCLIESNAVQHCHWIISYWMHVINEHTKLSV